MLAQDTTPGKILVLGLLANLPIFVMIIVLAITDDREAARRFALPVLLGTPLPALLALGIYLRALPERKGHNAAQWGSKLAIAALLLWALALIGELVRR